MFRSLVILLVFTCTCLYVQATPDSARFVHFDISNGFPTNNVYSLVTDVNGYTWFATDKGVVKYNGYTFTIYNTGNGLPADDVYELYADRSGRVWLNSHSYQIGYMKNGRYNQLPYVTSKRITNTYFVSESGDAVYFYVGDSEAGDLVFVIGSLLKTFPFNRYGDGIQKKYGVIDFYLANDLSLNVMDEKENIYQWDLLKGGTKLEYLFKADEALIYGYRYRRGSSPIGEQYSFRFNGKDLHRHNFRGRSIDKPITLSSMGADLDEHIYAFNPYYLSGNYNEISSLITNTHIYSISRDFKFVERAAIRDVVPTNSQLAFYLIDRIGNGWFTTKDDGVWMSPKPNSLLLSGKFSTLLRDCVFTGSVGNNAYWWNKKELTLHVISGNELLESVKFPIGTMVRTVTGNNDDVFIGGESGISQYSLKDRSLVVLEDKYKTRLKIENIGAHHKSILQYRKSAFEYVNLIKWVNGNLYSIGSDFVLLHTIKDDSIISEIRSPERFSGLQSIDSVFVLYNSQKMLVNNSVNGSSVTFVSEDLKSLGIGNIKQVGKDGFDNWYFLGDERLFLCNTRTKCFKTVRLNINLRDVHLNILDKELIVAGKFGIGYAPITGPGTVGDLQVMPNFIGGRPDYNQVKSLSVTNDGYIILQTDKGIFDFTKQQLRTAALFNATKGNVFKLMLQSPYERPVNGNDTIAIKQENQKIVLDVINYYGKGAVKYYYKTGQDLEWQESGAGEIFIGSMGAGKYHKILCKAKDDLWESKVYAIYIYRYPVWWQTNSWRTIFWIAGIVLFVVLVLITVLVTRYYVARKNERRRALTNLELQAIHSQINPHFIFNSLSAALFYINKKRFDDAYTHVSKFSQLLRSYLKSSHDRYVILEEEIKMLRNYIELQQIRFEEKFEYRIEVDNKLPINNIRIPSLLLQPLVENAINHGLFHREKGGILLLKFEQGADSTELVCIIDDNGVGREAARKINESTSTRESYGTTLTNQLLEVFKLYEKLDIKLDYTDKALPETGTVVTLTLKNIKYVA